MGTNENCHRYDHSNQRKPRDLTDVEWVLIEPLIPPAKRGGNTRTVVMREVVNALMYVLGTGCQSRALPKDLPARSACTGIAPSGGLMARSVLSITHCMSPVVSLQNERQGRLRPSSAARAGSNWEKLQVNSFSYIVQTEDGEKQGTHNPGDSATNNNYYSWY